MKKLLKLIKWLFLSALGIGIILFVIGYLTLEFHPVFGGEPSEEVMARKKASKNFDGEVFINLEKKNRPEWTGSWDVTKKFLLGFPGQFPETGLPIIEHQSVETYKQDFLMWFGHSSFLARIDGKHILFDPMMGDVAAPFDFLGTKRFNSEHPIEIKNLPEIDLVFISHDHYDHLDYGSIQQLSSKTKKFIVPLGVEAHLIRWGIPKENIIALDWWNNSEFQDIQFTCVPAHHFSGRAISDHNATLWSGWVLEGENNTIYHSGDGGYGNHFKTIGEKFGIDFALIECGQYNEHWKDIHMMPEETVQAAMDVKAKHLIPIHWGAFALSLHSWFDPIERASKEALQKGQPFMAPKIGEILMLNKPQPLDSYWWKPFSQVPL
jgi:L-ascorbate metabolism protein UlaG (beta-lactamase superfamily)